MTSLSIPFKAIQLDLHGDKLELVERVSYPEPLLRKIVNCDVEKVGFPTFDKLAAPGETGTLHAYLLKPKQPRPKSELRALVLSFYGGYNDFWTEGEVLCQAGYYVMSPAPRGSTDFGTKFFDLAAGDWGGAETLDDFAAGKFLRDRLGIPAARIGIFGHSRGGYDTMRAMTFPGEVNGVKESFRFGFGIAESGISDIIRAAKGGNISQWYANLTGGDPSKDAAKWNDRSPETHADAISGPLLLTHGSNDQRVPVTESRAMFAKLQQLKKEVYYTELPGQGHGYVGIDAQTQYYRAVFDFLGKLR
jgi:dipeptidyl aminopeptidase/acylaminoacyl peptidase